MWRINDNLPIKVGLLKFEELTVNKDNTVYEQITELAAKYKEKHSSGSISKIPGIQTARNFFRAVGIDPTKRRPSSEALLRRALNDKGFFRVNNLVDAANYCSLDFLLPICVYDADKIGSDIEIRRGKDDESYLALTGKELNLSGRYVISDSKGAFGSPITDSTRTAVSQTTVSAWVCIFASEDFSDSKLKDQMKKTEKKIIEFCSGHCHSTQILHYATN